MTAPGIEQDPLSDVLYDPRLTRGDKLVRVYWEDPRRLSDDMYRIIHELESAEDEREREAVVAQLSTAATFAFQERVGRINEIAAAIGRMEK